MVVVEVLVVVEEAFPLQALISKVLARITTRIEKNKNFFIS